MVDTPTVWLDLANGKRRRRHDAYGMWEVLSDLEVGVAGTVAFLEAPPLVPGNGRMSQMQSGYGLGVWTGLLAALGVEVRA